MKQDKVDLEIQQLLKRHKELLDELGKIQTEMRSIRTKINQLAKQNPILEGFAFLVLSEEKNFLEKFNDLDLSNDIKYIEILLAKTKSQNLKEKGDKNGKRIDKNK